MATDASQEGLPPEATWIIEESEYHPANEALGGTLYLLGNGYMGLRGSYEELATSTVQGLFVAGVYGKTRTRGFIAGDTYFRKRYVFDEELMAEQVDLISIINLPDPLHLKVYVGGKPFRLFEGHLLEYHRALDMKRGVLRRRVRWDNGDGLITRFEIERFCSMQNDHLIALRYQLIPENYSGTVRIESGIDAGVDQTYTDSLVAHSEAGLLVESAIPDPRVSVYQAVELRVYADDAPLLIPWDATTKNRRHLKTAELSVEAGKTYTIEKFISLYSTRDPGTANARQEAEQLVRTASQQGYRRCLAEHEQAWQHIWAQTDITIDGDAEAQRLMRFALYHIIIGTPRHDPSVSVGARGLSGKYYAGLVFWETDIYLQPYFAWTFPQWSRNHLAYRHALLNAARANAAKEKRAGARYPWESALDGHEETPAFYVCGHTQVHIVPDVALAFCKHLDITNDTAFFYGQGIEVVVECARFMAQTVTQNASSGRFEIKNVGGPDEYHPITDNNAYTNYMTARLMENAVRACQTLKTTLPERYAELVRRLQLTDAEVEHWGTIAANMYLPIEEATGLIAQCDGFFDLKDEWETVGGRFGGPGAEYHTCKGIKQPDVLLLFALFPERFQAQHFIVNWDYYNRFVTHGSSLSPSIHALIAARVGLVQKARELFLLAARFTLVDHNKDAAGGSHTGNYGGLWQSLIFGFAGMSLVEGVICLDPHLPHEWRRITFPIVYKGNRFTVSTAVGKVSIQAHAANPDTVTFSHAGQEIGISPGEQKDIVSRVSPRIV